LTYSRELKMVGSDILRTPDIVRSEFEADLVGHFFDLVQFQSDRRIAEIAHDRKPA